MNRFSTGEVAAGLQHVPLDGMCTEEVHACDERHPDQCPDGDSDECVTSGDGLPEGSGEGQQGTDHQCDDRRGHQYLG